MIDIDWKFASGLGLGGLAFLYLLKYIIPKLFAQYEGALKAFREELAAERKMHLEAIDRLVSRVDALGASLHGRKGP